MESLLLKRGFIIFVLGEDRAFRDMYVNINNLVGATET